MDKLVFPHLVITLFNKMKDINHLIEKYFAGETSIQEERQLRQYFNQTEIAEHLRPYQSLFQMQKATQEVAIPEFDFIFLEETTDNQPVSRIATFRTLPTYLLRIAALLVLGLGIWWSIQPEELNTTPLPQAINWEQYEVEDPEEALAEAKAALKLLSEKLGKSKH